MTGDDVVLHTKGFGELQKWLDECSRWTCKKSMKGESYKCALICEKEEEISNDKLKLYIMGGEMTMVRAAKCRGMTLAGRGITPRKNLERGKAEIQGAGSLAEMTGIETDAPQSRVRFVIETYLRSTYAYNVLVLNMTKQLQETDYEVFRRIFSAMLKRKERGVATKASKKPETLVQITTLKLKIESETN